jgi:hypothetical protein
MADRSLEGRLARECDVLCRFLVDAPATAHVRAAYARGHRSNPLLAARARGFDRVHVAVAAWHPLAARLADSYARLCRPAGVLRHKLVLLLAILESCAPSYEAFERPDGRSPAGVILALVWQSALFAITAAAALVLFAPIHAIVAGVARVRPARPVGRLTTPAARVDGA